MELIFPTAADSLLVIAKLAGEACNINCLYCYEKRKPYESTRFLTPSTLREFLRLAGPRPLALALHGGEPLLVGIDRMRALLAVLREHPAPIRLSIQTNGTLFSPQWADLFATQWPGIDIGVSLDGDRESSTFRVDYRGRNTHDRASRALDVLSDRGMDCGVIVVVTRAALNRPEVILDHLRTFPAVRAVKLSACLDYNVVSKTYTSPSGRQLLELNGSGQGAPGWATTPAEYTDFVERAADHWVSGGTFRQFLLEPVVSLVRAVHGRETHHSQFSTSKDPFIVTLYPDGRIGSSDELPMPEATLGQVADGHPLAELTDRFAHSPLATRMRRLLADCVGCPAQDACRGGALYERLRYEGTGLSDDYCDARRRLIGYGRRLADLGSTQ